MNTGRTSSPWESGDEADCVKFHVLNPSALIPGRDTMLRPEYVPHVTGEVKRVEWLAGLLISAAWQDADLTDAGLALQGELFRLAMLRLEVQASGEPRTWVGPKPGHCLAEAIRTMGHREDAGSGYSEETRRLVGALLEGA